MGFFAEYAVVNKLLKTGHEFVFYSESRHYYQYYSNLIKDLLDARKEILYITSDKKDPLLNYPPKGIQVVYCKWMLAFLFKKIKAKHFLMTMPDLDNYLFKRSSAVGNYIYIFHAAVSTHQQYRRHAFDHYDMIFCTGNYQVEELRAAEKHYGSKTKTLVPYGYPLFDELKAQAVRSSNSETVLIAPSWFNGCIFDVCIEELLQQLSAFPYKIILRSHPEYEKRNRKSFERIKKLLSACNGSLDEEPAVIKSLLAADILITDRSGIAFEYAFGVQRPVLFIDTKLKEVNSVWKELEIEPIENNIREQLGLCIPPQEIDRIADTIILLEKMRNGFPERMANLEGKFFYNNKDVRKEALEHLLK